MKSNKILSMSSNHPIPLDKINLNTQGYETD